MIDTAERLHAAALHLLRRLRREDAAAGLAPARLSALSVLVFGGPLPLGRLAAIEQVRPPTMTRIVAALEAGGLVRRAPDRADRRGVRVMATARGRRVMEQGRRRRVARLAAELRRLTPAERAALARASAILERLSGAAARG